jgi:hypothetical protein
LRRDERQAHSRAYDHGRPAANNHDHRDTSTDDGTTDYCGSALAGGPRHFVPTSDG